MDIVSTLSAIAIGLASIVVAGAAVWGLKSWSGELKRGAEFEVAKNVMLLGIRVRQRFITGRLPMTMGAESSERQKAHDETAEESRILDEWYARSRRINPLRESIGQLREASWEAKVVLEANAASVVEDVFRRLNSEFAEVATAVDAYFEEKYSHLGSAAVSTNEEWLVGLRHLVYGLENDELMHRVDSAVDELGLALQKYVR